MKTLIMLLCLSLSLPGTLYAARAKIDTVSRSPYVSALIMDAGTGEILHEENADTQAYPASVLKLMGLLLTLEAVEQGRLSLTEMVQVTKEAAQMGGSQVYLDPKEQFSVEDLLYALMVQSANDAAVALATRVAGSKAGFVALMNKRAKELGMTSTEFHSVHGLPPSEGQQVDVTTARDLAILGRALAGKPEVFAYTSTVEREFRNGEFMMRTHNHLLKQVPGCDGFKTGYFRAAGFSIVATAARNGVRIIVVVLGSEDRKVRDSKAIELLEKGFALVPPKTSVARPASTTPTVQKEPEQPQVETRQLPDPAEIVPRQERDSAPAWRTFLFGVITGILLSAVASYLFSRKKNRGYRRYTR
jgi:D-alanyl-D-alanine carboxypeptidase (penicillin-binding protein 5/6)